MRHQSSSGARFGAGSGRVYGKTTRPDHRLRQLSWRLGWRSPQVPDLLRKYWPEIAAVLAIAMAVDRLVRR